MKKSGTNSIKSFKSGMGSAKMTSAPQNTRTGSGSRPNGGSIVVPTTAPMDSHTLGRAPKGWLK